LPAGVPAFFPAYFLHRLLPCFALLGLAWFALLGFAWLALLFFGLALLCLAWLCFALPCFALFCSALLACYSDDMTLEQLAKLKRANEDDAGTPSPRLV